MIFILFLFFFRSKFFGAVEMYDNIKIVTFLNGAYNEILNNFICNIKFLKNILFLRTLIYFGSEIL